MNRRKLLSLIPFFATTPAFAYVDSESMGDKIVKFAQKNKHIYKFIQPSRDFINKVYYSEKDVVIGRSEVAERNRSFTWIYEYFKNNNNCKSISWAQNHISNNWTINLSCQKTPISVTVNYDLR